MKRILKIVLLVILLIAVVSGIGLYALMGGFYQLKEYKESHDQLSDVLTLPQGQIQGYIDEDYPEVEVYKGIPYATAPIGDLRWREPQGAQNWSGILDCTKYSSSAMQAKPVPFLNYTEEFIIRNNELSEDCLYLNVWTRTEDRINQSKLPVIVFIHGGGFSGGGSSCEIYDGEAIADKGAVYVNINYRVGIFGYLATSELVSENPSAGNYGLMDQIKALEWVHENISLFGGDPDNVTIMGQSAGGQSVQALLLCEKAKDLFQHAIVMSSNALTRTGYQLQSERITNAERNIDKSLTELRNMSAEEVLKIDYDDLGPCIDHIYLDDTYANSILKGDSNDVDILFTMADNADTPFWSTQTDSCFYGLYTSDNIDTTEDLMASLYYQFLAREKTGAYQGNIYFQNFEHMMPMSEKYWGTTHTSDVPYMLNIFADYRKDYWQETDYQLGNKMSDYLLYFAKYGIMPAEWKRVDNGCFYMNFDSEAELKEVTIEQLQEYWAANEEYEWLR